MHQQQEEVDIEEWPENVPQPDWSKIHKKLSNIPTLEKLLAEKDPNAFTDDELALAKIMVAEIVSLNPQTEQEIQQIFKMQRKKYKTDNKKSLLIAAYRHLLLSGTIQPSTFLEKYLITKAPRSHSGVLVVTIFTGPQFEIGGKVQRFSCKWNCYYCPNEPGQPRSYLLNEPGVRRANRLKFDPVDQFRDRVAALVAIGHPPDKIELLILGGTWESYPEEYRISFVRDAFYAANTFFDSEPLRARKTVLEEQLINERAKVRIIGVTIETRPDTIDQEMIVGLRKLGVTRIQLGIQHTDDSVLMSVNRQATREDAVRAIRQLKDACFKVDVHLMPDLPGVTPAMDKEMFDVMLNDEKMQADQWKIYPCQITPFTVIQEWYQTGKYFPYGLDNLIDVIVYVKMRVHPWIRLNRVIRDIPTEYVLGGVDVANLRQIIENKMKAAGKPCRCIRCREIGSDPEAAAKVAQSVLKVRQYVGSGADELFLSFESKDEKLLFGFLRLRLSASAGGVAFPELHQCALIRELHVYGKLVTTGSSSKNEAQHVGLGSRLIQQAEKIARERGFSRIAVISGVGVRDYYRKRGFVMYQEDRGAYLIKDISRGGESSVAAQPSSSASVLTRLLLCTGSEEERTWHWRVFCFVMTLLLVTFSIVAHEETIIS